MIPDDVVERVRDQADIVQVIGEHVKLKRVGTSFRGPCPFHQGKDANFSVSPKKVTCSPSCRSDSASTSSVP
jgi:DNA primase